MLYDTNKPKRNPHWKATLKNNYFKPLYKQTYGQKDWNGQSISNESCDTDASLQEVLEPPRDGEIDFNHVIIVRSLLGACHIAGIV